MKVIETAFEGVYLIDNFVALDTRGTFVKTYNQEFFETHGLCTHFKESYYTISAKDTIRGMHFQLPPDDHEKLVYVINGAIEDVLLDLRRASSTYGQYMKVAINDVNHRSVYIPKGFAHGFKALEDKTTVVYQVSSVYNQASDHGISFDSFGYDWNLKQPVMSKRDQAFEGFKTFESVNPF